MRWIATVPLPSAPLKSRVAVVVVLALAALLALTACGGGGDREPTATRPAAETPTQPPTVEQPTSTPEETTPEAAIKLCTLVTAEEADEALGEFVTGILDQADQYCQYDTESGIYLRIEPGTPADFETGAELQGAEGETVPNIADGAAWFGGTLGVLSVRQGDAYFRIVLNLPETDSSSQLEIAKSLAAKAVERVP